MKQMRLYIILMILGFSVFVFPIDKIILDNPLDFDELMEKKNVFLKMCLDFDAADGYFYFLDTRFGMIFKVEEKSGKLVKTLSGKGQGPFELIAAERIRVKNKKVFILDRGFNGIKVFDLEGNGLKEIKFNHGVGRATFDVNQKDEIFLGRIDMEIGTFVSVYNLNGERVQSLIPVPNIKDFNKQTMDWYYYLRLDNQDSIYLLFYLSRRLARYNRKGNLLWNQPVKNEILDAFPNRDSVKRTSKKSINIRSSVFSIEVSPGNNVIVGHRSGGCLFSPSGKPMAIIKTSVDHNLGRIKVFDGKLVNLLTFGNTINIYRFKEE